MLFAYTLAIVPPHGRPNLPITDRCIYLGSSPDPSPSGVQNQERGLPLRFIGRSAPLWPICQLLNAISHAACCL